ncbi:hypothetical protein J2X07_000645 [Fictibacillus barbaricus]|uniref:Uncharacterized protein n=1 Tax=Fictibacillus barbaricus TaxID=182136 RepID=A0ABU1TWT3_9BACL|nr:hypothetical protein [Fictibacillus barbaricus]
MIVDVCKKIGDIIVLVFFLHILISFMVLGIALVLGRIVEFKRSALNNMVAITALSGIFLVGTGIIIGIGDSLHAYLYITFILQLIITCLFFLIYRHFKKVGNSKLINISSMILVMISYLTYVYYIIGSFLY